MKNLLNIPAGEAGFVLIVSLVLMVLLSLIGMAVQHAGTMEIRIAGNHQQYMRSFFEADGSAALAVQFLEQNIACGQGFSGSKTEIAESYAVAGHSDGNSTVQIKTEDFYLNQRAEHVYKPLTAGELEAYSGIPAEQEIPDLIIPAGGALRKEWGSNLVAIAGESRMASGSSQQMAAGYEGPGRSAGNYGSYLLYDVTARYVGPGKAEAVIHHQWRHAMGAEGGCDE